MKPTIKTKYVLIAVLLVVVTLVFFLIRPFFIALLSGVVIAYVFYPVYAFINKRLKRKNLSALLVSVLVILLFTLPVVFIFNSVSREAYVSYLIARQKLTSGELIPVDCPEQSNFICGFTDSIKNFLSDPQYRYYLETSTQHISTFFINYISNFLFSLPRLLLNFFIIIFVMFYFFKDGQLLFARIESVIPLKEAHRKNMLEKLKEVTYAVIYGHIFVALVQGALGALGFFIFGINSPILWGLVMAFFALIPYIGPPIVWLPVALFKIMEGYANADSSLVTKGVLLILYGLIVVGLADNILKPKIIGAKANIHPILVLLGVLGGINLFGMIGIIAGPIILALFITFIRIYEEERERA